LRFFGQVENFFARPFSHSPDHQFSLPGAWISGEHMAPALDEKFFLAQEREHRQRRSALVCYLLSQCFRINLQTDFRWTLVTTRAVFKCHKLRFEAGNV